MGFINVIKKRGQISTEYLIVMGFLVFITLSTLAGALIYSANLKDQIKTNQIEGFAKKIISSAETVFYSGEPSKTTINVFLPEGINSILLNEKEIIFVFETNSGENTMTFVGEVELSGTLSPSGGLKKIKITARNSDVLVEEIE